jgi:hypothetical protein
MKVLVENIQQLLIKINNPNTEPEYSLTKTCYGQAADVCVIRPLLKIAQAPWLRPES